MGRRKLRRARPADITSHALGSHGLVRLPYAWHASNQKHILIARRPRIIYKSKEGMENLTGRQTKTRPATESSSLSARRHHLLCESVGLADTFVPEGESFLDGGHAEGARVRRHVRVLEEPQALGQHGLAESTQVGPLRVVRFTLTGLDLAIPADESDIDRRFDERVPLRSVVEAVVPDELTLEPDEGLDQAVFAEFRRRAPPLTSARAQDGDEVAENQKLPAVQGLRNALVPDKLVQAGLRGKKV